MIWRSEEKYRQLVANINNIILHWDDAFRINDNVKKNGERVWISRTNGAIVDG